MRRDGNSIVTGDSPLTDPRSFASSVIFHGLLVVVGWLAVLNVPMQATQTAEAQPDPNPVLLALDPEPVEYVGFWFFLGIGVTSTGYHDDAPAQRAVTAFPRGKNAELLAQAKPAVTGRYRPRQG